MSVRYRFRANSSLWFLPIREVENGKEGYWIVIDENGIITESKIVILRNIELGMGWEMLE